MLELPISDEDYTVKNNSSEATVTSQRRYLNSQQHNGYRNYGQRNNGSIVGDEGDFSIEESMYAVNIPGRIDPITK